MNSGISSACSMTVSAAVPRQPCSSTFRDGGGAHLTYRTPHRSDDKSLAMDTPAGASAVGDMRCEIRTMPLPTARPGTCSWPRSVAVAVAVAVPASVQRWHETHGTPAVARSCRDSSLVAATLEKMLQRPHVLLWALEYEGYSEIVCQPQKRVRARVFSTHCYHQAPSQNGACDFRGKKARHLHLKGIDICHENHTHPL